MFYKTGVDICNTKSMYNFLKSHFTYPTMNACNGIYSFANNMKMYKLGLAGNWWPVLQYLENTEYDEVMCMISDFEAEHPSVRIGVNGRSGAYLVLVERGSYRLVVPPCVADYDSYEEYKADVHSMGYTVEDDFWALRDAVTLVRDFDRLCDDIRNYCDRLSTYDFKTRQLEDICERFNDEYAHDLQVLNFADLKVVNGKVKISDVYSLVCLAEALTKVIKTVNYGYQVEVQRDYLTIKDE